MDGMDVNDIVVCDFEALGRLPASQQPHACHLPAAVVKLEQLMRHTAILVGKYSHGVLQYIAFADLDESVSEIIPAAVLPYDENRGILLHRRRAALLWRARRVVMLLNKLAERSAQTRCGEGKKRDDRSETRCPLLWPRGAADGRLEAGAPRCAPRRRPRYSPPSDQATQHGLQVAAGQRGAQSCLRGRFGHFVDAETGIHSLGGFRDRLQVEAQYAGMIYEAPHAREHRWRARAGARLLPRPVSLTMRDPQPFE